MKWFTTITITAIAATSYCPSTEAHSWLDCVDWDAATQTCHGYARDWSLRKAEPLGQDVGRDIRPGAPVPQGLFCDPQKEPRRPNPEDSYTVDYPMTRVGAGQSLTLRWPAKNHATVGTQRGVQVFISKTADGGDDFSHITSKEDWIQQYPNLERTFSNCNPNVAGVDRAECTGLFEIPRDLDTGVYTLMWWWEFNAGEYYNSCADIHVTSIADGGEPATNSPTPSPIPGAPTPLPTALENCPFTGSVEIENEWNNGFVALINLVATESMTQWDLEINFANGEAIGNIWNCRLNGVASDGVITVSNPNGYLSNLSPGDTVQCGFQASKPDGTTAFGGAGAYVKAKGCADNFPLPGEVIEEEEEEENNSPECNYNGTFAIANPSEGVCMDTCDCNEGYYGTACENDSPQSYWEVLFTLPAGSSLNFASSCDLQESHRNILESALNVIVMREVSIVMYDATSTSIKFRIYDGGAISEEAFSAAVQNWDVQLVQVP